MIDKGFLGRGGAIGFISSAAGLGWEKSLAKLKELLAIGDFDTAAAWAREQRDGQLLLDEAGRLRVRRELRPTRSARSGIRINATCPGPTDTPLAQANKDAWLGFGADYRKELGIDAATPMEQAYPLLFLCSAAASAISGVTLITDSGYMMSGHHRVVPERHADGADPDGPDLRGAP